MNSVVLIGYSGHAYVVCEVLRSSSYNVVGYFDKVLKESNPYTLQYLGDERDDSSIDILSKTSYFVSIGNNNIRAQITTRLFESTRTAPINAIAGKSVISTSAILGRGILVSFGTIVNAQSIVDDGVILNTGCVIEHECKIGSFAHIAPGAVLTGNVIIGSKSFIGANAVIRQGVTIGDGAVIGAGAVIIDDVPAYSTVVGNPGRVIISDK